MTFKDLIMQTSFEEIVAEYKRLLHSHGHLYTKHEKAILRIIFEKLRTTEPVENKNMTIWAGRYNVNGYEEGNPYAYSLVSTPWKDWLGMEIDAYLLENVRHAVRGLVEEALQHHAVLIRCEDTHIVFAGHLDAGVAGGLRHFVIDFGL